MPVKEAGDMCGSLAQMEDRVSAENIDQLTQCFVKQLDPLKVFLFGSFADGSYTEESDYDFYIVINDDGNVGEASDQAYKSIRFVQNRPVDIVIGTKGRFDRIRRAEGSLQIEGEVAKKGILLYDKNDADLAEEAV